MKWLIHNSGDGGYEQNCKRIQDDTAYSLFKGISALQSASRCNFIIYVWHESETAIKVFKQ